MKPCCMVCDQPIRVQAGWIWVPQYNQHVGICLSCAKLSVKHPEEDVMALRRRQEPEYEPDPGSVVPF